MSLQITEDELDYIASKNGYGSMLEACQDVIDSVYPASSLAAREQTAAELLKVMQKEGYTRPISALHASDL